MASCGHYYLHGLAESHLVSQDARHAQLQHAHTHRPPPPRGRVSPTEGRLDACKAAEALTWYVRYSHCTPTNCSQYKTDIKQAASQTPTPID